MAKQFLDLRLPFSTDKCNEEWGEYPQLQYDRGETKEPERENKSRNLEKYGQSYSQNPKFLPKEPETQRQAISGIENEKWWPAMQKELKFLSKKKQMDPSRVS